MVAVPFHLHYALTRRQRLAAELHPWLPAIAATLGFTVGVAYLSAVVSRWFLPLLLLPPVVYRGLFAFLFDLAVHARRAVEVVVGESELEVTTRGVRRRRPLDGVFQVFRSEDGSTWTVLHLDGSALTVPASAVTGEQLDYLKSFARRAAAERRAARTEG